MNRIFFIFFIALFYLANANAQEIFSTKLKESKDRADDLYAIKEYRGALVIYKNMLKEIPDNMEVNYKTGVCYLYSLHNKDEAIKYIEKALKLNADKKLRNGMREIYYHLMKAYQENYKFQQAIDIYETNKEIIERDRKTFKKVKNVLHNCYSGREIIKNPVKIEVNNLGKQINSKFSDHSPVISADESVIIFTSNRTGGLDTTASENGEYTEDIYIAYNKEGQWQKPQNMGKRINTDSHEATIGLSPDGEMLFIYRAEERSHGNIYVSYLSGDRWSSPELLEAGSISTRKSRETHASLSADGNSIYFTSNRKGGYGGLDIYIVRKLPNGLWSMPQNLGPAINTEFDEEGPYIHPDGVTLFFSSRGHHSMGGFDIFSSEFDTETGTWMKPKNIGYPINTTDDDVFYVLTPDGKRAYYSSIKTDGYGGSDLFMIDLADAEEKQISVVTGFIASCGETIPHVVINVTDNYTDETIGIYRPNSKSGKYLFILKRGVDYSVDYIMNDSIVKQKILRLDATSPSKIKIDSIKLECPEKDERIFYNGKYYDSQIAVRDILFRVGKAKITENDDLNKIADYLIENPQAVIEICAYADATGSESGNKRLTKKRARAVKKYLVDRGANRDQIEDNGYGEQNPIAKNKNEDGSWNREGLRYNRRIEFRMIKQGKLSLLIRPIESIPPNLKHPDYNPDFKL